MLWLLHSKKRQPQIPKPPEIVKIFKSIKEHYVQNIKHGMLMVFMEILKLDCYAVQKQHPVTESLT